MKREILILVAVLIVLGLVFVVTQRPFERGSTENGRSGDLLLADLDPEMIDAVSIESPEGSLVMRRANGEWLIEKEGRTMHVDPDQIDRLLEFPTGLTRAELVSVVPEKHAVFEVDDESGTTLELSAAGSPVASIVVGKRGPDFLNAYVRLAGENEVYLSQEGAPHITADADRWRDRRVMPFDAGDVTRVTVAVGRERTVAARGPDGTWSLVEPGEARLDDRAVTRLLSGLSGMRATGFGEPIPFLSSVQEALHTVFTVELADGSTRTAMVGALEGDSYRVQRPDREAIYLVSSSGIDRAAEAARELAAAAQTPQGE